MATVTEDIMNRHEIVTRIRRRLVERNLYMHSLERLYGSCMGVAARERERYERNFRMLQEWDREKLRSLDERIRGVVPEKKQCDIFVL